MSTHIIYYGYPVDDPQHVLPSLTERGLMYLRCKPSELRVTIIGQYTSPNYAWYASNLPAFLVSNQENRQVVVKPTQYYPFQGKDVLPIIHPPLGIILRKTTDALNETISSLGGYPVQFRGKQITIIPTYDLTDIRSFVNSPDCIQTCPVPANVVNCDGLKMLLFTARLVYGFLVCQRYPTQAKLSEEPEKSSSVEESAKRQRPNPPEPGISSSSSSSTPVTSFVSTYVRCNEIPTNCHESRILVRALFLRYQGLKCPSFVGAKQTYRTYQVFSLRTYLNWPRMIVTRFCPSSTTT